MTIAGGTKLGSYEIVAPAGAGGMGEVYCARDTRLNRVVAIKILPAHLADKPELRERFEREARTVASLNHPRICTLHDIGHQDGVDFLVLSRPPCIKPSVSTHSPRSAEASVSMSIIARTSFTPTATRIVPQTRSRELAC